MLGIIGNKTNKIFYNKIVIKKELLLFKNTITGECFLSHRNKNELGYQHLLKIIRHQLVINGKLNLDLNVFSWLEYKNLNAEDKIPLVSYIKSNHSYMLLPDRVEEFVNIKNYRSSGIVLQGTNKDYILREVNEDTKTLETLEQLKALREGLFKQIKMNNGVIDIPSLLDFVNTLGRGKFVCMIATTNEEESSEQNEVIDMFKQPVQ